ncbi:MAG: DUF1631 domain-containing protein, partial [Oleiphilaceae bacterium]|nr:DUF1631 domain-containing protein [Oleiphilaceae bacterium]
RDDEFEEQIAVNSMVTKSRAYFEGPLIQLQARFSHIYPEASDARPVNPMAPEHLCGAFVEVSQTLEIQIRERLIVLKQFDRYVVSNLGILLDEANRALIQAGVIPDFRYRGKVGAQIERGSPAQPNDGNQTRRTGSQAEGRSESALFDHIHKLLARQRKQDDAQLPRFRNPDLHLISGAELSQLLDQFPAEQTGNLDDLSAGEPVIINALEVVEQLITAAQSAGDRKPALTEMDEDLINLVSMLFDFILNDDNLSAPIQVLISRLQIPILKVVIKDRSFFSRADHPARKLLNALARAGIGWSDSTEKSQDKLYDQIHHIAQRVANEFDGDIALFEALFDEFEQFQSQENRKAALLEQRTRESERGRIKSRKAQETVDQLLQEKVSQHEVPDSVRDILLNGWSRVMFLAYLRDEVEHRWCPTVRVVEDLIWCLQPHMDGKERDQWVRLVPALLKSLQAGLQEVSYNSARLDDMMIKVKRELTEAFHAHAQPRTEGARTPVTEPAQTVGDAATPAQNRQLQELEDIGIGQYIGLIANIEVGHWVEFKLVNGSRFRCKLSAVIEEADCFVFVNRMGLKVIEKSRTQLAHDIKNERLVMLQQNPLFDRALGAVMGDLRRKTA